MLSFLFGFFSVFLVLDGKFIKFRDLSGKEQDFYRESHNPSRMSTKANSNFGDIIFEDNFDGFNLSAWKHVISAFGGGNWEFEYYTNNRSNSYVRDGVLYLKPTLTNNTYTADGYLTSGTLDMGGETPADLCTAQMDYGCWRVGSPSIILNPIQSARIRTAESFTFRYGRIELRAQMPRGDWIWPAVFMMPKLNRYGDWPSSGEIDLIEIRGNDKLMATVNGEQQDIGASQAATTLHWGPYYGADPFDLTRNYSYNTDLWSTSFNNWTIDWTPDGINASLNGVEFANYPTPSNGFWDFGNFDVTDPNSFNPWNLTEAQNAPFNQEFYLILCNAVGGTMGYWPDGSVSSPQDFPSYTKPWTDFDESGATDFWNARNSWYPTWYPFKNNGEAAALKFDYIRVYEYIGEDANNSWD